MNKWSVLQYIYEPTEVCRKVKRQKGYSFFFYLYEMHGCSIENYEYMKKTQKTELHINPFKYLQVIM